MTRGGLDQSVINDLSNSIINPRDRAETCQRAVNFNGAVRQSAAIDFERLAGGDRQCCVHRHCDVGAGWHYPAAFIGASVIVRPAIITLSVLYIRPTPHMT